MRAIQEFAQVVFTVDLPQDHLQAGDVGTVVDISHGGAAYLIEVFFVDGSTFAVVGAEAGQVRPVSDRDLLHARTLPADTLAAEG
jgi:hypothetical protein